MGRVVGCSIPPHCVPPRAWNPGFWGELLSLPKLKRHSQSHPELYQVEIHL